MKRPAVIPKQGSVACPSCGAVGVGGIGGCRAVFDDLAGREFSKPEYFAVHRLSVDAYSLQHPEQFMKSSKSAATHLAGMCWSMERGDTLHLPGPLKKWVDGNRTFTTVAAPEPGQRGMLTVLHAVGAVTPDAYRIRVTEWAKSAWSAWSMHWPQARQWVNEALEG